MIFSYLEEFDISLHGAADGVEALKFIWSKMPDIVIADINMPGIDGIKFCQALREKPGGKDAEVIFLSGSQSAQHVAAGINLGARYFLAKPVNKAELIEKLAPIIARKRADPPAK